MQISQIIGGYTLGGADMLRRAMGKKKPEEMAKHRATIAEGAAKKGYDPALAEQLFDLMTKFAEYGFNKSHTAAYAVVSYQTAWLKAHHCAAFMAATMSSELDNTDQLRVFYEDALANKLTMLPPDVNQSFYRFVPVSRKEIRYALGAIKGTGEAAVEHIVAERAKNGPYTDLFDFCKRTDKRVVNKRVIEALIRGGAFDSVDDHRAKLLANVQLALDQAEQIASNANQGGLFDMFDDIAPAIEMVDCRRWDTIQRLAEEKLAIGFYLSGHPFEGYAPEVRGFIKQQLNRLGSSKELQTLTGVVLEIRVKQTQRGRMAFVKLDDATGQVEVSVFSELFDACRNKIKEDALLVVEAKVSYDDYTGGNRIVADKVFDLAEARSRFAKKLALKMNGQSDCQKLKTLLSPYASEGCPVAIQYQNGNAQCEIELGQTWRVTLRNELLDQLRQWLGERAVEIRYG